MFSAIYLLKGRSVKTNHKAQAPANHLKDMLAQCGSSELSSSNLKRNNPQISFNKRMDESSILNMEKKYIYAT